MKCLTESAQFISAIFEEYEADRKEKDKMINSLEEKVLGLTEKADKLSYLVDRQEQYSRRKCMLIHGLNENQNEDTDEVVVNKIKSEINLEISPGDIDRTLRIGVPSKGKNRLIIVKFIYQQKDKKGLKGKKMSVTKSLTKSKMTLLKEARNKFGYNGVWITNQKIINKNEGDTKAKLYVDCYSGKQKLC